MIVKSNNILIIICLFYVLSSPLIMLPFIEKIPFLIIPVLMVYSMLLLLHLSLGKKYTFSKEGLVVQFGFYKKKYKWEDIKTKQVFTVKRASVVNVNAYTILVFSKHKLRSFRLMKLIRPYEYAMFVHPLSFVFLTSVPVGMTDEMLKKSVAIYPVRIKEFTDLLKSWNVILEEGSI